MSTSNLDKKVSAVVEYIWQDAENNFRSKTRIIHSKAVEVVDSYGKKTVQHQLLPGIWNYDGSSTGQARTKDSEILLVPQMMVPDPFNVKHNSSSMFYYLLLCDTYHPSKGDKLIPTKQNTRYKADEIFAKDKTYKQYPWFGLEQEYVIYATKENSLGIPVCTFEGRKGFWSKGSKSLGLKLPSTFTERGQEKYYCGTGTDNVYGRKLVEFHFNLCLIAGIPLSGKNGEVGPCQWEYQVFYDGTDPIQAGDYMLLSRYLLVRSAEHFGVNVTFNPTPYMSSEFNKSGCHINYSYDKLRKEKGEYLHAIENLKKVHHSMIKHMGTNNERLTGTHETSKMDTFSSGVADRTATVRIPRETDRDGVGYIEYRAPASDVDPYTGTSMLYQATVVVDYETPKHEPILETTLEVFTDTENKSKTKVKAKSKPTKEAKTKPTKEVKTKKESNKKLVSSAPSASA